MKLNNKHTQFIEAYLTNGYNGTDAYQKVYPKSTYDSARATAPVLLAKPCIKEAIDIKKKELAEKCLVTKNDVIQVLVNILNDVNSKPSEKIKAGEVILKACGYNAPTEQNVNMNVEQPLFLDLDE